MSNEKKSATLGMPHGTASHRLRKIILFDILKRHKENLCFRCGKDIEASDDLSIEHKRPWEGISAELFWDLANVAFSHLRCNRPQTGWGGSGPSPKPRPEGTVWCGVCKKFLPENDFYRDERKHHSFRVPCKRCYDVRRGRVSRGSTSG